MSHTAPADRLPLSTSLLFSTGDLSSSLTLAIQTFFQLVFLTDVARLSPTTVAWVLGITRLWDAFNDPLIGLLSDRIRSRWGRRRVLLISGSIPLGLSFALCWLVPSWPSFWLAAYYTVVIIAFDTAFTIVHVGFNSLTPLMTYDYDERSRLNGFRMIFSLGGTLAAILFATVIAEVTSSEVQRFAIVGISLGLMAMVPPWIVFSITRDVDRNVPNPREMGLLEALRTTFQNRAFVMLTSMFFASWTATSVLAALLIYYANYYLEIPDQANYLVLAAQGSAVVSVPLIVMVANRWDKPKAFLIGIGFWCLVLIGLCLLPRNSVALAYACAIGCGPGIATAAVIPWSMLPDVIEQEQQQNGQRREGAYYSIASFIQKLGTGFALWSLGLSLGWAGYVTPTDADPMPAQPMSALNMIRLIAGPGTISLLLLSLPFAWFYPVSRANHQAARQAIQLK